MSVEMTSQYASARRSDRGTIRRQKQLLGTHHGSLRQLYDAVSEVILIVNQNRQIVFFNSAVPVLLDMDDADRLYGMRPGEALGCVYADRNAGGCGTSEFCSRCGSVNAILSALSNKADLQECRILTDAVETLDLLVRTTPLAVDGEIFSIVAIVDVSHEKRRRALEHTFFHDIMNTASSVKMLARMLKNVPPERDDTAFRDTLLVGIQQLIDELCSQKELLAAENNELVVSSQPFDGVELVQDVVDMFQSRFARHTIHLELPGDALLLNTDRGLLRRVLANMILNAVEASSPDETITVSCGTHDGHAEFRVHNERHIPADIQRNLFHRSFSTKGSGRGIGTYSMKMLSERYLRGRIHFTSSPQSGTVFAARYPL